ncbi:MAG TPA: DUF58 domain-containing protein [Chloroflexota bacterium]|nr:DUF58 domain-containing protein [Chloroflexota bacterium]
MNALAWLSKLRQGATRGWVDLPGAEHEGPLLDGPFLKRLEHLTLTVGRHGTNGFAGEHPSPRKASSVEFADYRDYRPGDDFRLIDWNVYARLGELTLRLTEATESTTLHLLLDCSGSMAWGIPSKFRLMQRLAAALGCVALARYDNVAVGVLRDAKAQILPRLRGKNDTGRLLSVIDDLRPSGTVDLAAAAASYCGAPRKGVAVLISDLLAPTGTRETVAALRRAGLTPTVLQVLAREESAPTLEGPFDLVDCETGAVLTTAINGEALRAYGERFDSWTREMEAACASQRASFIRVFTDQPIDELLFGVLRGQVVR